MQLELMRCVPFLVPVTASSNLYRFTLIGDMMSLEDCSVRSDVTRQPSPRVADSRSFLGLYLNSMSL